MFHDQSLDSPPHYEQPMRPRHTTDSMELVISTPLDPPKSAGWKCWGRRSAYSKATGVVLCRGHDTNGTTTIARVENSINIDSPLDWDP